ncbi:hypothetical protein ADP8_05234 (plasmid) [Roseomonas mucosa]|nr:hypothetical protein ADP8_05234 [Roseomonas mucosa]
MAEDAVGPSAPTLLRRLRPLGWVRRRRRSGKESIGHLVLRGPCPGRVLAVSQPMTRSFADGLLL